MDLSTLKQRSEAEWEIPAEGDMRVPVILYGSRALLEDMDEKVREQARNVACLPGILQGSFVMPDGHWGYGFPIGGVAAFDPDEGVVSAGGVGFDISCGVRCLLLGVRAEAILAVREELARALYGTIPAGVGSRGKLHVAGHVMDAMLRGGARWAVTPGLDAGVQLAYEEGRKTSESSLLKSLNVADIDPGASIGAHLEWDSKIGKAPTSLLGRVRQNIDTDRGAQADLRFNVGLHGSGGFILAAYAQATWASSKYIETFYVVNNADSGLLHAGLGLLGSYDLTRHWTAVASVQWRRLHGDAAGSVIVENKSNYYANAGIAYRF